MPSRDLDESAHSAVGQCLQRRLTQRDSRENGETCGDGGDPWDGLDEGRETRLRSKCCGRGGGEDADFCRVWMVQRGCEHKFCEFTGEAPIIPPCVRYKRGVCMQRTRWTLPLTSASGVETYARVTRCDGFWYGFTNSPGAIASSSKGPKGTS